MVSEIWTEKYRPKEFHEVVGQDDIVKRIKSLTDSLNIPHLLLIKNLEETADNYKDLCTFYSGNIKKIDDDLIIIFIRINEHLNEIYQLFYKYDEQKMEDLFRKTKLTYNKRASLKNNTAYCLSPICENIRNLLTILVEINL